MLIDSSSLFQEKGRTFTQTFEKLRVQRQAPDKHREIFKCAYCPSGNKEFILKEERETVVNNLLLGSDVLAILSTAFPKSMTYMIFACELKDAISKDLRLTYLAAKKPYISKTK